SGFVPTVGRWSPRARPLATRSASPSSPRRAATRKNASKEKTMAQRIALVTGGMGGLGEAICMKLERMGIRVVVTYSPANTKYKEWLQEMESQGHKFSAYPCDVTDFESCQKTVAQVAKDLGPIDILI